MSEPSAGRTEEERAAAFAELMRAEKARDKSPLSGLAVGALVFGLLGGVAFTTLIGGLLSAAACVICAVGAMIQIRQGERRGTGLVVVGIVALVGWAVGIVILMDRLGLLS